MIPILFSPTATSFNTNGIGRLSDVITCTVHEARNGAFELEMLYPVTGAHFSDIQHSSIIVAKPSARRTNQAFRVYKITKPLNGRVTILADHISYQLSFIPVLPFSAPDLIGALSGFKSNAVESCPFTFSTDIEMQKKVSIIGDSIDTFDQEGYMIPGYRTYYPALGVTNVDQTWWMQVINTKGLTIDVNASWSGSCATNIRASLGYPSFYDRVGVVGNPDIIFVTLGTNDSSLNAPLGEYDYQTQYQNLSEDTFRTAYIKGIKALQDLYPNAEIVCIAERMKDSYKSSIESIAASLGAQYIDASIYTTSSGVHPGIAGMTEIAETVKNALLIDSGTASYSVSVPASIRSYLGGRAGSVLDVYGGEWEWDNYHCILHQTRGQDNGYAIRYGKNLIDLTQEENIQNTYTGICPYYKTDDAMTILTTEPRVVRAATAGNFPFQRTVEMDFTDKFDTTPTEAALRAVAAAYVAANGIGVPAVSISLNFVNLADTAEYANLATGNVDLCDMVTVRFVKLGINVKSKIVGIEYDVLKERYTTLDVGSKAASLSDTLVDEMDRLAISPTTAQMHRAVDMATGVLNKGQGGYVIYNRNADGHPNETLYLDENSGGNLYASQHILRINYAGIGFSDSGYGGPYSQSWDLYGHLTLGGINNSYGDFTILDENAVPVVQMDKNGFVLWNISAKGYMSNGVLYADADLTTPITPEEGNYYYDVVQRAVYLWDGTAYTAQTGTGGIYARMTRDEGLGVYHGVIDFSWGDGSVGFYADGTKVQLGDWIVDSTYGRSILQSDESLGRTTGMSAETDDEDQLYLWAGWADSDDYVFQVGHGDAYVMYNGVQYEIGRSISRLNNCVSAYSDGGDGDDDDEWDETNTGSADIEEGFTANGEVFNDLEPEP